ncbi:40S ribosomal protein S4 [Linnemannia zychae]|nr:40S ribosomal protein S4 [Linnemannia zychae]
MLKDHHIQSTVALLENIGNNNPHNPFQTIDLDRLQDDGNDVALSTEASAGHALNSQNTSTRSKREIVALDGFMFDSSVLQDRDDEPSVTDEHGQDRGFGTLSPHYQNDEETPEYRLLDDTKQHALLASPASSALSLSSSSSSASPSASTSSIVTAPYIPDQSPGSDSGSAESFFSLTTDESADSNQSESPLPSSASSHEELRHSRDPGDIKEVQIEAEDPSHLFWVPFHMHPEIAPNAYNNWLHKHGVDSNGQSTLLAVRKPSVNRRRSVLSAEYNPELDDEEEERPIAINRPDSILSSARTDTRENDHSHGSETNTDFLSGVFSAPLEQMGEPPLKTKTSLRRSLSHTRHVPSSVASDEGSVGEDLATVRRTGGLQRSGPSLLRRSARTRIRRNSTASNDKTDRSRLRQATDENGEYPAVTLVDPGPLPLPSDAPTVAVDQADIVSDDDSTIVQTEESKPLKRFVSTLRDSSKPTITTYVEPELLEQQRQEIEGVPKPTSTSTHTTHSSHADLPDLSAYTGTVVSTVTYPIPPPVKLTQNLLQHPSHKPKPSQERPPVLSHQSLAWSWLRGKEKDGEGQQEGKLQPKRDATLPAPSLAPSSKSMAKKPSALSLLFSRNGKTTAKAQPAMSGLPAPASHRNAQRNTSPEENHELDPCRMPIHTERVIYRMSHVKLANPRRPLHEQVLISNMMFWYLGVIEQETEMHHQRQQQQQQQAHPQEIPLPPNHNPLELTLQQQQQQQQSQPLSTQQTAIEAGQDYANGTSLESSSSRPASQSPSLRQKRSQTELSTIEVRIEGSEDFVPQPQQDSNSHARSPGKEVFIEFMHVVHSDDDDYDEESMMGGYSEQYKWSDEEDGHMPADNGVGETGNSVYLRSGSPVQGGFSVYSSSSLDLANGPGTARGPKKHLKRLNAPKHWMLDKLTGTYAPRPTAGPHKLRECLPLVILMRNRLKYALNGKEVQSILMQRLVKVDNKVRTDSTFPAGFMDAISIEKTGENFRLVYDTKGRFTVHRITAEEAKYKLCKVKKVQLGAKGIPFVVTHDGRTLRYPDPLIKVNDTVKLDLETGKFNEFVKFEVGNVAMVTGGRNTGRVGVITHRERHVGGFDIVHIKDVLDRQFATRLSNVFVIGEGNKPWVSLPKNKGVKLTIAEERDRRRAAAN